jgi:hypothetical protein
MRRILSVAIKTIATWGDWFGVRDVKDLQYWFFILVSSTLGTLEKLSHLAEVSNFLDFSWARRHLGLFLMLENRFDMGLPIIMLSIAWINIGVLDCYLILIVSMNSHFHSLMLLWLAVFFYLILLLLLLLLMLFRYFLVEGRITLLLLFFYFLNLRNYLFWCFNFHSILPFKSH